MSFRTIGIVGVGLIGGSLGLAVKRSEPGARVLGFGRDPEKLKTARRMGAVDDWRIETGEDIGDCDLIVLATPVEHILTLLPILGNRLRPGTIVTDVGSTKRRICADAWRHFPAGVEFVGGHPIAGREVTGVENSVADLFESAPYVLCPRPGATADVLGRLQRLVERLGARAWIMSPEEHDRAAARLSHVPQLLSTALAGMSGEEKLEIAGSGFRDMTRLAGSPYSVWQSILETNRDNVELALGELIEHLQGMRTRLESGRLSQEFSRAMEVYKRLFQSGRKNRSL